jgi:hypothetical protein
LRLARPVDGRTLRAWSELPADLAGCLAAAGISARRLPEGVGAELEEAD